MTSKFTLLGDSSKTSKRPGWRPLVAVPLFALAAGAGLTVPSIASATDTEEAPSGVVESTDVTDENVVDEGAAEEEAGEEAPAEDATDEKPSEESPAEGEEGTGEEGATEEEPSEDPATNPFNCAPGVVYSISESGDVEAHGVDITIPKIGELSEANGLAVGSNGVAYAYERAVNLLDIYKFSDGSWSKVTTWTTQASLDFVAGAVDPNGTYMIGHFNKAGDEFLIFKLDGTYLDFVGFIDVSPTSKANNGDMAFDGQGNLTVVRGRGAQVDLITISAEDLAKATGSTSEALPSSQVTSSGGGALSNVNGASFDADGNLWLGDSSSIVKYDPRTETLISGAGYEVSNSTDLAGCVAPPTLSVSKVLTGERQADEQFGLSIGFNGSVYAEGTTAGAGQEVTGGVNPTIVNPGGKFTISESVLENEAGVTAEDYDAAWSCVDQAGTEIAKGEGTQGEVTIPESVDNQPAAVECTFSNTPDPRSASVAWAKADEEGAALAGSVWNLVDPKDNAIKVEDCVADSADKCTGVDKDPVAGKFLVDDLKWGDYTLSELEAPEGYKLAEIEETFTLNGKNLEQVFDEAFVNEKAPVIEPTPEPTTEPKPEPKPELPKTGTSAELLGMLGGGAVLLMLGGGTLVAIRRKHS